MKNNTSQTESQTIETTENSITIGIATTPMEKNKSIIFVIKFM